MSERKFLIIEGNRVSIQTKINQWGSTGYTVYIETFIKTATDPVTGENSYTCVLWREKASSS